MSYEKAKRNYEAENGIGVTLRCSVCRKETSRDVLSGFGARCRECFESYCSAAPRYEIKTDYPNDKLGWAKRIIDKQQRGERVSIYAAKLAQDALGTKHDL